MKPEGLKPKHRNKDTDVFRLRTVRSWNASNRSRKGGSRLVRKSHKIGRVWHKRKLQKDLSEETI